MNPGKHLVIIFFALFIFDTHALPSAPEGGNVSLGWDDWRAYVENPIFALPPEITIADHKIFVDTVQKGTRTHTVIKVVGIFINSGTNETYIGALKFDDEGRQISWISGEIDNGGILKIIKNVYYTGSKSVYSAIHTRFDVRKLIESKQDHISISALCKDSSTDKFYIAYSMLFDQKIDGAIDITNDELTPLIISDESAPYMHTFYNSSLDVQSDTLLSFTTNNNSHIAIISLEKNYTGSGLITEIEGISIPALPSSNYKNPMAFFALNISDVDKGLENLKQNYYHLLYLEDDNNDGKGALKLLLADQKGRLQNIPIFNNGDGPVTIDAEINTGNFKAFISTVLTGDPLTSGLYQNLSSLGINNAVGCSIFCLFVKGTELYIAALDFQGIFRSILNISKKFHISRSANKEFTYIADHVANNGVNKTLKILKIFTGAIYDKTIITSYIEYINTPSTSQEFVKQWSGEGYRSILSTTGLEPGKLRLTKYEGNEISNGTNITWTEGGSILLQVQEEKDGDSLLREPAIISQTTQIKSMFSIDTIIENGSKGSGNTTTNYLLFTDNNGKTINGKRTIDSKISGSIPAPVDTTATFNAEEYVMVIGHSYDIETYPLDDVAILRGDASISEDERTYLKIGTTRPNMPYHDKDIEELQQWSYKTVARRLIEGIDTGEAQKILSEESNAAKTVKTPLKPPDIKSISIERFNPTLVGEELVRGFVQLTNNSIKARRLVVSTSVDNEATYQLLYSGPFQEDHFILNIPEGTGILFVKAYVEDNDGNQSEEVMTNANVASPENPSGPLTTTPPGISEDTGGSGGRRLGCYVATSASAGEHSAIVELLQVFRRNTLEYNHTGSTCLNIYYNTSLKPALYLKGSITKRVLDFIGSLSSYTFPIWILAPAFCVAFLQRRPRV